MEGTNSRILELEEANRKLQLKNDELAQDLYRVSIDKDSLYAFCDEFEHQLNYTRESEAKLKKLFQLSYDGIMFLNCQGIILDCNEACVQMFGYDDKVGLVGKTIFDITPARYHEQTTQMLTKLVNNKGSQRVEKYFLAQKGNEFPALVSSSKIDKQSCVISSVIQDLSLQKKHEQQQSTLIELLKKQNSIQQILQNASSTNTLKAELCQALLQHTGGDAVWLMVCRNDMTDALYFSQKVDKSITFQQLKGNFREQLLFPKPIGKIDGQVKKLRGDAIVDLSKIVILPDVTDQLLFSSHLKSGKRYYWGINYALPFSPLTEEIAFTQHILPQITTAFNSLDTYEQLIENEARFRTLIEKSDDIIVIRNEQGECTYVSPSIKQYGFEPSDIIGKSATQFVHQDDLSKVMVATDELLSFPGESRHLKNIQLILPNGIVGHTNLTITNHINQHGLNGFVINIKDVSDTIMFEKQLIESEKKYRSLFENASDGIALIKDEKIAMCNSKLLQLFGGDTSQVIGRMFNDFTSLEQPNDLSSAVIKETLDQVTAGYTNAMKWRVRRLDNRELDTHVSLSQANLSEGNYVMAIIHDVSELVKAQNRIQENEVLLSGIFEAMNDGIYLCSYDRNITYMNSAMRLQLGDTISSANCYQQIYGSNKACKWCLLGKKNAKKQKHEAHEVLNPRNRKHYHITKTPIVINSKEYLLHISRDITDIKKAQQSILQKEEKFRKIFNHTNDAILITDVTGNYLEVNNIACERAGFTKSEFLKHNLREVNQFSSENNVDEYLKTIITEGESTTELHYTSQEGHLIQTEISGKLITYEDQRALLHISRDVTIRKEMERQVLNETINAEEKERSRLARDLHDGVGPYLSATKMFLQTLENTNDRQQQIDIFQKVKQSIDDIIINIKEISNNLSPHVLQNFGLVSALKSFRNKLACDNSQVNIQSNCEGKRFDEKLEISVFRIAIELINNTLKHANSRNISIAIMTDSSYLKLIIIHDGSGFNVQKAMEKGRGNGIYNIMSRVKSLKGRCQFDTDESRAFKFMAYFPL